MISLLINQMCDYADALTKEGAYERREGVRDCIALASTVFFRCMDSARRLRNLPDSELFERLATMIPDIKCFKSKKTGQMYYQTGESYKSSSYTFDTAYEAVIAKLKCQAGFAMPKNRLGIDEVIYEYEPMVNTEKSVSALLNNSAIRDIVKESYMPLARRLLVTDDLLTKLNENGYQICIVKKVTDNILEDVVNANADGNSADEED